MNTHKTVTIRLSLEVIKLLKELSIKNTRKIPNYVQNLVNEHVKMLFPDRFPE